MSQRVLRCGWHVRCASRRRGFGLRDGLNDFDAAGAGTFSTWMRDNIVGASIVLIAMAFVPCAVFLKQWDRRRVAQDGGLSMVYGGQYEKKCYPTGISSLPEDPAGVPTRPPYRTRTVV